MTDLKTTKIRTLKRYYESICDEYRRRLCEMWELRFDDSWWVADIIGGGLFLCDWWYPLEMEQIRLVVDNTISEKIWLEYCDFVESEVIDNGRSIPRINFYNWWKGCRPEMLKDE